MRFNKVAITLRMNTSNLAILDFREESEARERDFNEISDSSSFLTSISYKPILIKRFGIGFDLIFKDFNSWGRGINSRFTIIKFSRDGRHRIFNEHFPR